MLNENKTSIKVEVTKMFYVNGYPSYICRSNEYNIKRGGYRFATMDDLKKYYGIKKLSRTDRKESTISAKGKKMEWLVYEVDISSDYIIDEIKNES